MFFGRVLGTKRGVRGFKSFGKVEKNNACCEKRYTHSRDCVIRIRMEQLFRELTFNDLKLMSFLRSEKSLRAVARIMNLEPAAISKRLVRIEELFGLEIVKRSPRGFIFTGDGERIVEKAEDILRNAEEVFGATAAKEEFEAVLSIGSRGFLNILLAEPFLRSAQSFFSENSTSFH